MGKHLKNKLYIIYTNYIQLTSINLVSEQRNGAIFAGY